MRERGEAAKIALLALLLVGLAGAVWYRSSNTTPDAAAQAAKTWEETEREVPDDDLPTPWPPKKGEAYPDVVLQTPDGKTVRLSDHKGKVILIEPIGMSCPGCQGFLGGNTIGGFAGVTPQKGLRSIEEFAEERGLDLDDPNLLYVHLVLYSMKMGAPTLKDGREWAEHWGMNERKNGLVLLGDPRYINPGSYKMIPGFQLIGPDFVLEMDASGHNPVDRLYDLLDRAKALLK